MTDANNRQVGGSHYASAYQHWDLVWRCQLGYFPGQITKYALRFRKKNGLQDLEKARHFAAKYLELIQDQVMGCAGALAPSRIERELTHFFAVNDADSRVQRVFSLMTHSHDADSIKKVGELLSELEAELRGAPEGAATPAYVNQAQDSPPPP
jgi:Protein of unknwon function (DUF3310)